MKVKTRTSTTINSISIKEHLNLYFIFLQEYSHADRNKVQQNLNPNTLGTAKVSASTGVKALIVRSVHLQIESIYNCIYHFHRIKVNLNEYAAALLIQARKLAYLRVLHKQ